MSKPFKPDPGGTERGDATRQKLLTAALDVFGRHGFDGTTTRALANAAGVNLQAIPYYFGGKEGLYIAAAEHLASLITGHVGDLRERIRGRLMAAERESRPLTVAEARAFLTDLAQTMVTVLVSRESESWARFLIREQMHPTEAFQRVYQGAMKPTLMIAARLIGIVLDEDPTSEHVRLRTFTLLGSLMVFRVAHAAVLAQMEWREIGPGQAEAIRALAREVVQSIIPSGAAS
jgi:TetR/AcrR family transcriptional regulator, regulator of cefoperazone and chloramphenicol sensitivity